MIHAMKVRPKCCRLAAGERMPVTPSPEDEYSESSRSEMVCLRSVGSMGS